ncbi:acyltransferase [Methylobacterium tarhaniae]|uniref:acyltransferase n=1 Tax=Methylobacterium tarhaniae TaxID=1187852 RepID=UPI000ADF20EC|nr:acyltransferase [Methylobacterium tarhaniae]
MGLAIQGDITNNDVQISKKFMDECQGTLVLHGTGSTVYIDTPNAAHSIFCTVASQARIVVGKNCVFGNLALHALEPGAVVMIGEDVGFNGQVSISAHERATIEIGNECLFASGVHVNASDVHSIFDLETHERINPAQDIVIGRHVWIGAGAQILKGTRIGDMSVVGAGSIVSGAHPGNVIIAGVPARTVRQGIYWRR